MSALQEEYRIIAAGAGWIERIDRGHVRIDGRDAAAFLQALVTNDVAALQPGEGRYAAFLTPNGRMTTDASISRRRDGWLLDVPGERARDLAARLDQSIFSEDVRVEDASQALTAVTVAGGRAAARVGEALGQPSERLDELVELAHLEVEDGFVARTGDTHLPTFTIVVPADRRALVIDRVSAAGVVPMSGALLEALRIDAARPRFGADMSEDTIPLEAGLLDRGISTTKGCYVGQEIIIRILHRGGGRVAKRLVKLELDAPPDGLPPPGTPLRSGDRTTGAITSVAWSPQSSRAIALGYVHRDDAEPGRQVSVGDTGATAAIVGFAG